ncbi:MAG: D-alanyl-D-alanine carboxypeptidase [Inquilinus sp.]|nr:D-alanyl-D-alanine carboxypeptidase [Inquilinus sp.]
MRYRWPRSDRPIRRSGLVLAALSALLLIALSTAPATANSRYAAIVIDADTGEVLHEENADRRRYPASLTKMMTLYMTFKALDEGTLSPDQRITVSRKAAGQAPSRLGLPAGSTIRVDNAILALVTKSANDIATALAEALGGTEFRFALKMTEEARRLGMRNTRFRNASGLPHREQVSTARDMALLSRALIRDFPQYYGYFAHERWTFRGRTYRNHNELLDSYDGMDGLKTGYIRASGYNLAASAKRGRLRLVAVVFGGRTSNSRNRAVQQLMDEAYASARGRYLVAHGGAELYPPLPPPRPTLDADGTLVATAVPLPPRRPQPEPAEASVQLASAAEVALETAPARAAASGLAERVSNVELSALSDIGSRPGLPSKVWGIQVGAFFDAATSQRAIDTAKNRVPDLLTAAPRTVTPIETERGRMFRARILGLDAATARAACDRLQNAGGDCLTISPDSDF